MKKGQVLQGTVAYVDFPNKGVVKVEEGKQVIVKNVLPGQEISFSVNKVRKGKGEGRLLEVLKKAPNELPEAPCPHFGICGGCTYQNLSYEDQLALKGQQVKKLMDAVVDPEKQVRMNSDSVIRWNLLLGTNIRMAPLLLACISVAAFMILFR